MNTTINYILLTTEASDRFMKFLTTFYKDFDVTRYGAFLSELSLGEGFFEVGQFDSIDGQPRTIDLTDESNWVA